jgi:integrase
MKLKLGERAIAKIKSDAKDEYKHDYTAWDKDMPGFGLRVRNGRASWVFQYQVHGRSHRIKLGDQNIMSADVARSAAKEAAGKVAASRRTGEAHPILEQKNIRDEMVRAEAKRPGDAQFGSRIEEYLAARSGNGNGLREASLIETRRYLTQHFRALHTIPLNQIRRIDVANVLSEIKSPAVHNRARSTLSTFFSWAIGRGWVEANPVVGTNKAEGESERKRVLTDEEIATVWLRAPDNSYGTILKLLLLTGCRRDEIGGLMWNQVDLNARTITIPGSRTKNGEQHVVPLSDTAMSILAGIARRDGYEHVFGRTLAAGFSGWSSAKAEFDAIVKLDDWVVHDLRRTVRTGIDKLGILPHICEAVLNHLPPKLVRTYNQNTYENEKRKALDTWAHHLKTIVAQATGANVTPLRKGEPRKPRR